MPIDETILDRVKRLAAWDKEPTITEDDLEAVIEQYQVIDANGVLPTEDDYEPTYNINLAIAECWDIKAGRATELISTDLDGDRMSADQIYEHCVQMAKKYRKRTSVSVRIPTEVSNQQSTESDWCE